MAEQVKDSFMTKRMREIVERIESPLKERIARLEAENARLTMRISELESALQREINWRCQRCRD